MAFLIRDNLVDVYLENLSKELNKKKIGRYSKEAAVRVMIEEREARKKNEV